MNPETIAQLAQKSLRVTIGATATLIETLQDPSQRDANLEKLRTELSQMTDEWEVKGESTEREARSFVDALISRASSRGGSPASSDLGTTGEADVTSTAQTPSATPLSPPVQSDVQSDLQELTTQIAALRAELERLRQQDR